MVSSAVPNAPAPSPPGSSRDLGPGSVLADRYRIDERLGRGSASEVYLAEQVFLRRKVAVKVLHADHPNLTDVVKRFEREAMVAAGIENPNIALALEFGELADGSLFFVVEYVPGKTLRAELASGPLSLERSLHIAKQVASALADTHEVGIVHHDLKPENLMLLRRGDDPDFVKVLDFGLAPMTAATKPGKAEFVLGTPGYMPPEQALGQPVDGRADLYSLGVVLFEMVAGVRLFEGSTGVLAKQLAGHVPTFAERAPGIQVSPELEKLVNRLLAPGVADRFTGADDVLEALNILSTGARASAPPPAPAPAPAPARSPSDKPAARSSAPPPMLRRTQSGPPVAADRLPPFEPPPPAKVPERLHAAGVAVDDSTVPTTLALPKLSVLPPFVPLPSVSAATAPPPAKAVKPAERVGSAVSSTSPTAGPLTAVRARAAKIVSQARSYAEPLRTQLKGKRKLVLGGALAAGLGVSLTAFLMLRSTSAETASDSRLSVNAAAPSASAQAVGALAPRVSPAGKTALAPVAAARGSDEASVFLSLASDYVRDRREVEAVALVSRVLSRQPELKDDPRIAGVLSKTVRAESPQAADESLSLLTGAMGERGAELMYALSLEPTLRDPVRRRVDTWLASKDFDRISSAALYSAVKLRSAKTCDQKHALLNLAADVGGKQTLELLREFDARTICGASDLKNCYPCLASDSRLKDSIQRVEKRLAQ